jgi:DNA repair protein RadC
LSLGQGIRTWPVDERPRERLLVAIFLRTGLPGKSAVDLARELLARFGGLRGLLSADAAALCACPGLGPAKYAQLQAALEMARRHLGEQITRGDALSDPAATRRFLQARLRDRAHEIFACLYLDNQHRVLGFEELFRGTLDGASVYPREVVKAALKHNAAALIFAHNHPSGVAEPSAADRSLTQRLRAALALVDIRVLDHLVVGDGEITSLAERGWL